jgi:hypothetical protein
LAITLVSPQSSAAWFRPVSPVAPVSRAQVSGADSDGDNDGGADDGASAQKIRPAPAPGTGLKIDISA